MVPQPVPGLTTAIVGINAKGLGVIHPFVHCGGDPRALCGFDDVAGWLIGGMANLLTTREVALMPGALELLTELREVGVPCVLVTSSERVIMDAVLEGWQSAPAPFAYEAGTWGPREADAFIEADSREWRRP